MNLNKGLLVYNMLRSQPCVRENRSYGKLNSRLPKKMEVGKGEALVDRFCRLGLFSPSQVRLSTLFICGEERLQTRSPQRQEARAQLQL